jgi:geranylgeranyl pyrophosphate synthase
MAPLTNAARFRMPDTPPPLAAQLHSAALDALLDLDSGRLPHAALLRTLLEPATEFLRRPGHRFRARLVEIGWSLAGREDPCPTALPLVVEVIHAGSLIVDDIQDDSASRRRGPALHRLYGVPLALNVGNWFYFWPFHLLPALGLAAEVELALHRRVTRAMARCHAGQALDLGVRVSTAVQRTVPAIVDATSDLKTGSLTELSAWLGAAAAGAPAHVTEAVARFARRMGIGLQMLDDLGNLRGTGEPSRRYDDLRLGRATWPWAWCALRLDARRFRALQRRAADVERGVAAVGLARTLDGLVRDHGRRAARAALDRARDDLRRALGCAASFAVLEAELARLCARHG